MLKNTNTIEIGLDSWILLLKSQAKAQNSDCEDFDCIVNICTEQVKITFEKERGDGIDQIWERIFSLAQTISNRENVRKLLEDLNNFK